MKINLAQSESVEYAALPAPAASWEELVMWGILCAASLILLVLVVRAGLQWWEARRPRQAPLDLGFLRDLLVELGATIEGADAERVTRWLEEADLESCAASVTARNELAALLQVPRYGGPAVDSAPIRTLVERWLEVSRRREESA